MSELATTLWSWAFANTVVAAVLAGLAVAAARWCKHPSIAHCLWVLVLVKLITPPLFELELPIYVKPEATVPLLAGPIPMDLAPSPSAVPAPIAAPTPPAASTTAASTTAATTASTTLLIDWSLLTLLTWLSGTALFLGVGLWRAVRFHRELRHARPASDAVDQETAYLAGRLGLRRVPRVRVLPGRVSPMLWGLFGRPQVLLPEVLERTLSYAQKRTLLAHELAHLHRRDHWVRLLEMLVRAVHWWNPIAVVACHKLREVEEECCDAWVVWALPDAQRHYADALLDTVEFLSDATHVTPAPASGIGKVQNLKRRLAMIMQGDNRKSLPRFGRLGLLAVAVAVLPLMPAFGQDKRLKPTHPAYAKQHQADQKAKTLHALHQAIRLLQKNKRTSEAHTLIELANQISSQGRSSRGRSSPRRSSQGRSSQGRSSQGRPATGRPAKSRRTARTGDRAATLRQHRQMLQDLEVHMKQIAVAMENAEKTGRTAEARALRDKLAQIKDRAAKVSAVSQDLEASLAHRTQREADANDQRLRELEVAKRNADRAIAQRERELVKAHEDLARRAAEIDRHAAEVHRARRHTEQADRMKRLEHQVSELTQVVHKLLRNRENQERRRRDLEVRNEVERESADVRRIQDALKRAREKRQRERVEREAKLEDARRKVEEQDKLERERKEIERRRKNARRAR